MFKIATVFYQYNVFTIDLDFENGFTFFSGNGSHILCNFWLHVWYCARRYVVYNFF